MKRCAELAGTTTSRYGDAAMNRYERNITVRGEARLRYLDGEFQIVSPGDFVRCAVTGKPIPLDELRYWSVALQEPYIDARVSLDRHLQTQKRA